MRGKQWAAGSSTEMRAIPRKAIALLWALSVVGASGATYLGIAARLGLQARSSVRSAVAVAAELGLVVVKLTGRGAGAKAVVVLTPRGAALVSVARKRNHVQEKT